MLHWGLLCTLQGDALIKHVYDVLRASPRWNDTLLIVTYDEHGGFFDHVQPPHAPAPDEVASVDPPFDFTRVGVRIPTIMASPRYAHPPPHAHTHTRYTHVCTFLRTYTHVRTRPHTHARWCQSCVHSHAIVQPSVGPLLENPQLGSQVLC